MKESWGVSREAIKRSRLPDTHEGMLDCVEKTNKRSWPPDIHEGMLDCV